MVNDDQFFVSDFMFKKYRYPIIFDSYPHP